MTSFHFSKDSFQLDEKHPDIAWTQDYMRAFGYLGDTPIMKGVLDTPTSEALYLFQETLKLKSTGIVDPETRKALENPRCGLPDYDANGPKDVLGRFRLRGCDYQASYRTLTYGFTNATPDIPGDGEREAVRHAFQTWQQVIPIDFVEISYLNKPTLSIGWQSGSHGDGFSFDGPGNVLAHAFYPPTCGGIHAGKCHFDDSEQWGLSDSGIQRDLESVALHEIGHLLGLEHSGDVSSVMYPSYFGERRALTQDDIDGIQAIYGKPGPSLRVITHVQSMSDIKSRDNEFSGTRGMSKRLEGFQIEIVDAIPGLSCRYRAHLQGLGDTNWVEEGQFVGTRGQSRRLEGFAIELTGAESGNYTVIYMAHLQGTGDTDYYADGDFCGSKNKSRRLEGLLVRIEPL